VCAAFFEQRLLDHLAQNGGAGLDVINRSTGWAALALQGPRSRDVLSQVTDAALDNAGFRWLSARWITIAGHDVLALRLSYAGELGWELHGPAESMLHVYDALWSAGADHDIANYGSFAMNVMRMEKGFKGAGELTNEVTLPEADVMRFVNLEAGDFVGREATIASQKAAKDGAMPWICAYLSIEADGKADGHGGEAVMHDGRVVGSTSSVAYGHSVGSVLAFAYISPEAAVPGTALEVVVMNEARAATVLGEAAYDPQNLRPRTDG
ncbi:MAG: glycine cleavage T C-terminal barrel domain-containing protein, partial [Pseudomonadota bacterium]|nr:glycine cleavage T C-terminal barrel domain-containing protein [Pseudomonadota bacterium]